MFRGIESVLIGSADATKLAEFYREKVGLKQTMEAEMGEDNTNVFMFEFENKTSLAVMDHSEVKGKAHNPERIIFNIEVDNIEEEFKKLVDNGVKKITDIYHVENYGHIATFEDLDGNYFQIVQIRAS